MTVRPAGFSRAEMDAGAPKCSAPCPTRAHRSVRGLAATHEALHVRVMTQRPQPLEQRADFPAGETDSATRMVLRPRVLRIVALAWAVLTVVKATEGYLHNVLSDAPASFSWQLLNDLPIGIAGLLATPVALWLAFRFPITKTTWRRNLPALLGGSALLVVAMNILRMQLWSWLDVLPPLGMSRLTLASVAGSFHIDLLNMVFVMGAAHFVLRVRDEQRRSVAAARLEAELANARLHALQSQMQPHFLFNTLHTIGQLVRAQRGPESLRVVELLGDLLRRSLKAGGAATATLAEEIEVARTYLEIEHVRFADRLRVHWDVDPAVLSVRVPVLLVQPLVENAIRHGIAPSSTASTVRVSVRRAQDDV